MKLQIKNAVLEVDAAMPVVTIQGPSRTGKSSLLDEIKESAAKYLTNPAHLFWKDTQVEKESHFDVLSVMLKLQNERIEAMRRAGVSSIHEYNMTNPYNYMHEYILSIDEPNCYDADRLQLIARNMRVTGGYIFICGKNLPERLQRMAAVRITAVGKGEYEIESRTTTKTLMVINS